MSSAGDIKARGSKGEAFELEGGRHGAAHEGEIARGFRSLPMMFGDYGLRGFAFCEVWAKAMGMGRTLVRF